MVEAIFHRRPQAIGDEETETIQLFRLAGLLHDVGHYPFSHATERAVKLHGSKSGAPGYVHELLGKRILDNDTEIRDALKKHDIDPASIAAIFSRDPKLKATQKLGNLISSDLDADRLDYLPRTSHSTGLPYGFVDRDYLISQLCEDSERRPCLTRNGLRAADAFLISRLMDYRQGAFHKAVAAFEWLLVDVTVALLGLPKYDLNLSESGVEEMIENGKWADFTDADLMSRIEKELHSERCFGDPVVAKKAEAIVCRRTPKMVAESEEFVQLLTRGDRARDAYELTIQALETARRQWSDDFQIDSNLWTVWRRRIGLSSMGSRMPTSDQYKEPDAEQRDDFEQLIRLADPGKESKLLIETRPALSSLLANYNLEIIRVYVLLPELPPDETEKLRVAISDRIHHDVKAAGWTDA